jgi:uncharacterized membrane protein
MEIFFLRHPLHPALAHFPVALWIAATAADLIALRTGNLTWWQVSHSVAAGGTFMGALTLLAGLLELWLRKIPRAAARWLGVHASLMVSALLCFMVSLSWRTFAPPPMSAVWLSILGCTLVLAGGFCGGTLVYRFGVGVSWRDQRNR